MKESSDEALSRIVHTSPTLKAGRVCLRWPRWSERTRCVLRQLPCIGARIRRQRSLDRTRRRGGSTEVATSLLPPRLCGRPSPGG
eukprot:scaffold93909_cov54-Phaeocystis_antarctica.AAC.4